MPGPLHDPTPRPDPAPRPESEHTRFLRLFITCAGGLIVPRPSPIAPR